MLTDLQSKSIDIYIDQGDTYLQSFIVKDSGGIVVDLTGLTITCVMKRYANTSTVYTLVPLIVTPLTGTISLSMSTTISATLKNPKYIYSVYLSDVTNKVMIMNGFVHVTNT